MSSRSVSQIAYRLLIVCGENDSSMTGASMQVLASRVNGSQFVNMPKAGHAVHADQPGRMAKLLDAFFKQ